MSLGSQSVRFLAFAAPTCPSYPSAYCLLTRLITQNMTSMSLGFDNANPMGQTIFPLRCLQNRFQNDLIIGPRISRYSIGRPSRWKVALFIRLIDVCISIVFTLLALQASRTRHSVMGDISISDSTFENLERAFLC